MKYKYRMIITIYLGDAWKKIKKEIETTYYQSITEVKQDVTFLLNSTNKFFIWGELMINKKYLIDIELEEI